MVMTHADGNDNFIDSGGDGTGRPCVYEQFYVIQNELMKYDLEKVCR